MKIKEETLNRIKALLGSEHCREQEPMKLHTSMEVGGPAAYFFEPGSEEEVLSLLQILKEEEIPFYVIGNGTNLIVKDEGFDGVIIRMMRMSRIDARGEVLFAECGALLKDIAKEALDHSLTGFEFASGIPGSLGGAVTMNAGAYDGEMKDVIREVRLLDKDGNVFVKSAEEMDFSYRHSICSEGDYLVLSAVIALQKGAQEQIRNRMEELSEKRREKQPMEFPSSGSTFRRPEGYFAGKLITDAGLKGFRMGGAQVSEKHAGFIINRDHATAEDVLSLIAHVQKEVLRREGVELKCEVKIL